MISNNYIILRRHSKIIMTSLAEICHAMRDFQKVRAIKRQSVTNVQYLYDTAKYANISAKVSAAIVMSFDEENKSAVLVAGHVVLEFDDGRVIDPSYDVSSLKNVTYFTNIKDFISVFDDKSALNAQCNVKKHLREHLAMIKVAEQMNCGEIIVGDEEFYIAQAKYIERLFNRKSAKAI